MADEKKHSLGIETTKPFKGNVIVRSGRSYNTISEDKLDVWLEGLATIIQEYRVERERNPGDTIIVTMADINDPDGDVSVHVIKSRKKKTVKEIKEDVKSGKAVLQEVDDISEKLKNESAASKKVKEQMKAAAREKKTKK